MLSASASIPPIWIGALLKILPWVNITLAHGLYALTNVANLDRMPANGAVAMVAPVKVAGGSAAPVRILALVKVE